MRFIATLILGGLCSTPLWAHFNMLLPQSPSAKVGDTVVVSYQWGHPFERDFFDAPMPKELSFVTPSGKRAIATEQLTEVKIPTSEKKTAIARQLRFTVPGQGKERERGDYVFALQTDPIWMAEDEEFYQDTVKVVLHLEAQKGWDQSLDLPFELVPLTRPYGLQAGMVFQTQAMLKGKPLAGCLVEIEKYNSVKPKVLPPEEQITRVVKSDPNGVITCTLPESGWWGITAQHEMGTKEREGKKYPLIQRATFWVFVDPKE